MTHSNVWLFVFLLALFSCKGKPSGEEEERQQVRIQQKLEEVAVKAMTAKRAPFNLELVSNGKAEATRKATITFASNDVVKTVFVKNGDRVKAGDPLVAIDEYNARLRLEEAQLGVDRALLDVKMDMINEGLTLTTIEDTAKLHPERRRIIFLQRGFTSATKNYANALREYANVVTKAPFNGVVADMEVKPYNLSSAYKSVCMLIDDTQMEVVFSVLETEIRNILPGMEVTITPYADHQSTLTGKIREINPRIDENGMVKVKAVTPNKGAVLVDGMNVSILVKRQLENKLVIPKSAVLPRQGRKVVFVHERGMAMWRYVITGYENSTEVSIEEGINEGEEVIYENNLGLSHLNRVAVKNSE